ncbi:MAG: LamG-like jellyroll fold domain-containing protein, partial [Actinomycetota bacterium]
MDGSVSATGTISSNSVPTRIGAYAGGSPGEYMDGRIDQVRIWSRALSPAEVAAHFATSPRVVHESGLRAVSTVRGPLMSGSNHVGPGESITWSGVTAYYEGTTVTPPDSEFDLRIQENPATTWTQSTGASLNLITNAPSGDDSSDVHNVEIVGVPGGGPHGRRSFLLRVDATAPGPTPSLTANGASPSAWTDTDSFTIAAVAPQDLTGISAAWYKINSLPTSPGDGTRQVAVPFVVSTSTDGVTPLYLWAEDGVGNKDHNSRVQVDLRLDRVAPAFIDFEIYEDGAWRPLSYWQHSNQTPLIRATMSAGHSGLQVSTAQWRYSTNGGGSWSGLTGTGLSVHTCAGMSGCAASDGQTGTFYVKIASIPFNLDSGTQNQFQIQARKMSGPATTSIVAPQNVKIDTGGPAI